MIPPIGVRITSNPTEADTCRQYLVPKLQAAEWDAEPHSIAEQRQFTDGRIVVAGTKATRQKRKKADYLLPLRTRFHDRRRPGEGRIQVTIRWPSTGEGLRTNSWFEFRILHEWQRHR
jgi:hypothetical protein